MGGEPEKKLSSFMKAGAILLKESCPACSSPLLKLPSGEVYCGICEKKVVVVKPGEDISPIITDSVLTSIDGTICLKLQELNKLISEERDQGQLLELARLLVAWLDALERLRRVKKAG